MRVSNLHFIVRKYQSLGICKATSFLLTPEHALKLLNDLAAIDVRVVGCDCWRFVDQEIKDPTRILEIVGGGTWVENPFEKSVSTNAKIVKEFLVNKLPQDADFVSLIIDDPQIKGPFSYLFCETEE